MAPKAKAKGTAEPPAPTRSKTPPRTSKGTPTPRAPVAASTEKPKVQSQADDRGAGGASKERHKKLDSLDLLPSKGEREPLHVPKLLRSRSSPPKAPSGPSTFGSSKEDNETVAGWVEHDTKIRNAMPLNPTAEDLSCEKALPLHPAAEAALSRGKKRRGVKRYAGIVAQSSRVDQVVFGRDLDFTTTGDDSDLKAYEGSAGLPSHFHMKAGGVKKIETPKDSALIHTPLGVTAEAKQEENRRKEFRHPALSPFHSPGMAEVFGHDEGGPMEDPARSPIHHGAAGARPFRSPKVRPQETSRSTNLVAAVVFGGEGDVPEKSSLAESRKKRVDPTETFADLAGRISAELNFHEKRGKRLVAGRESDSSGSAGCPSSSLADQLAGWHPEARDRLKKTAVGFEEPPSALNCVSGKVLYGQASPRQEPLWAERKANAQRQVPGRKHLGALGMPFMEQQADIFATKPLVRSLTPPPHVGCGTPRSRMSAEFFNGSAGKPSTFAEWDLPRPSRSVTPPPQRGPKDEKVHGIPSQHADNARRARGGPNPAFGPSTVGSLLCGG